jgi:multisubunit Na+/H+ antiporter MnhB subunit
MAADERTEISMTPQLGKRVVLVETVVRAVYPVMLIGAAWLWYRGHNAPGGGFIGALMAVSGTAAYALVFGVDAARARIPLGPLRLSALGLALAAGSGIPALIAGSPFLTHPWTNVSLAVTTLPVSSVMVFDLGVMLCVWGALAGFCLRLLEDDA